MLLDARMEARHARFRHDEIAGVAAPDQEFDLDLRQFVPAIAKSELQGLAPTEQALESR